MNKQKELTYEMVMQMFATSSKEADKRSAEADKRSAEADKRSAEFDANLKKSKEEADKRSAELDIQLKELTTNVNATTKSIREMREENSATFQRTSEFVDKTTKSVQDMREELGGIGKSNGKMAEELVRNSLEKIMTFGGIEFDDLRPLGYYSKKHNKRAQFDIVLTNGSTVAIVEVKHRVKEKHITELVTKKVADFRLLYPEYNNHKMLLGIGGMWFEDNSEKEANEQGVGIIKIVGEVVEFQTNEMKIF